jgi:uncharacterized protein YjbI with pentapeptide repeats
MLGLGLLMAILKNGVQTWNKGRQDYFSILPDLNGANLNNADLSWADLSKAFLNDAKLQILNSQIEFNL